jgi:glycosyltransferase involved in cell wall biosynthesis
MNLDHLHSNRNRFKIEANTGATPHFGNPYHTKRVAIFRSELLRPTETFIRDQATELTTWHPVLLGLKEIAQGLRTPDIAREVVTGSGNPLLRTLYFWFSRPIPQLVKRLRQLRVSLIHAHFGTDATDIWPSVKALDLPMLVTLHGYDINIHREWWERGHGGLRRRVYPRRLLRLAQEPRVRFIAVSKAIKQRAIEYGIPEEKISVSYIGVDVRRFRPSGLPLSQRRKRILFAGRMVEKKAPLLMIRAFAEVRRKIQDAELTMIGNGPLLDDARKLAAQLAVPVEFIGTCTSDEVLAEMHKARVFCLPSITATNGDAEGFGLVLLEAQACGVPVITSALGGSDEGLLNGKTGYAFNEGSMKDLVSGLLESMSDDSALIHTSTNAVKFASEFFDIRRCTRDLEFIYDKLAQNVDNT